MPDAAGLLSPVVENVPVQRSITPEVKQVVADQVAAPTPAKRLSWLGGRPLEPSIVPRSRESSVASESSRLSLLSLDEGGIAEEEPQRLLGENGGLCAQITGIVDCGEYREYCIVIEQWSKRDPDGTLEMTRVVGRARRRFSEFRLLSQLLQPLGVPFRVRRHFISDTDSIKRARVKKLGEYLNAVLRAAGDALPADLLKFVGIDARLLLDEMQAAEAAAAAARAAYQAAAEMEVAAEAAEAEEARAAVAAEVTAASIAHSLAVFAAETQAIAIVKDALHTASNAAAVAHGAKAGALVVSARAGFPPFVFVLRALGCMPPAA